MTYTLYVGTQLYWDYGQNAGCLVGEEGSGGRNGMEVEVAEGSVMKYKMKGEDQVYEGVVERVKRDTVQLKDGEREKWSMGWADIDVVDYAGE